MSFFPLVAAPRLCDGKLYIEALRARKDGVGLSHVTMSLDGLDALAGVSLQHSMGYNVLVAIDLQLCDLHSALSGRFHPDVVDDIVAEVRGGEEVR